MPTLDHSSDRTPKPWDKRCCEPECRRKTRTARADRCKDHHNQRTREIHAKKARASTALARVQRGLPPVGICWNCESPTGSPEDGRTRYCAECRKARDADRALITRERDSADRRLAVRKAMISIGRRLQRMGAESDVGVSEMQEMRQLARFLLKMTITPPDKLAIGAERDRRHRERKAA